MCGTFVPDRRRTEQYTLTSIVVQKVLTVLKGTKCAQGHVTGAIVLLRRTYTELFSDLSPNRLVSKCELYLSKSNLRHAL